MIHSVIERIVSRPPAPGNRISFVRLDGTESYDLAAVYEMAGEVARGLRELGVEPGDRIGVLAANRLEWVLLDLAALRLKAVTAGFDIAKFVPDPALISRYDLTLLFTDRSANTAGGPLLSIDSLPRSSSIRPLDAPAYWPGDVTTIKFTSGSTGEPKGLGATVGSTDAALLAVQEMFEHGPGDDIFVFLPLSLIQQRFWIYSALCFRHDITICTYEAALPTLPRVRPTVVMGVPGFYETAKRLIEARGIRHNGALRASARSVFGDRIRYLWTGSAPARTELLRFYGEAGLPIYEGYGLNEAGIVAKNYPRAHREGSVGQVMPGQKVLFDADGRISVQSDHPIVTRYEYAPAGESERVFGPDGVVRTGDLGYLDEDGFLFIRGRADDVIVLDNGRKVIVRPIEERLRAAAAIEDCVVFCPAQTRLVAVVSPSSEPADEAAIEEHVARSNAVLGRDEQISKVVIARPRFSVGNGMLTSQFKPQRGRILDRFRSEITA